ncbi:Alpha-(1,4)-fucosyltransferase [Vitis vinifera]|uniref:Alpha-(1,4)-fucosyltransferase n=1 Tax=Vitis vinifera TaxID=29760 RepID=A0A438GE95_VITVI|nr:Alpha-(1,4)-fucosyltransferase [Vitis vinifera]
MQFNNADCLKNQKGLQVFTFKQLHFVTGGFGQSNMVGHGRFGLVYQGVLHDGRKIVVKLMDRTRRQGKDEFKVEMKSLSPSPMSLYAKSVKRGLNLRGPDNDKVEFKISPGEITTAIKAGLEANTQMRLYTGSPMEAKHHAYSNMRIDQNGFSSLQDIDGQSGPRVIADASCLRFLPTSLMLCCLRPPLPHFRDAIEMHFEYTRIFKWGRKRSGVEDKFISHSFGKCLNNVGGLDMALFLYPKCADNAHEASKWWDHLHYATSHHKPLTFSDPLDLRPSAAAGVNANAPQIAPQNQSLMDKLATVFKSAYDSLGLETSGGKSANIQKIWYLMQTLMGNTSQIVTEHTIFDHKLRLVFNKSETPESDSTIMTKEHFSEIQLVLHEVSFDTLERTNSSEAPKATIVIPDSEPKKMEKVASGFIWSSASLGGNLVMTQRNHFPSGIQYFCH